MDPGLIGGALGVAGLLGLLLGLGLGLWLGQRHAAGLASDLVVARQAERAAAEARAVALSRLETALAALEQQRGRCAAAETQAQAAATEIALSRQEVAAARQQMADWAETKAQLLQATEASVLATAQQISSKLLEDHKRETAEARQAAETQIRSTTEGLEKQVQILADGVSQLKGQVVEKSRLLDTVWRALASPSGAGYFAEIGLANILKSFGLVEGRDFILQPSLIGPDAARKRPDALVFLPGNAVLVIDSKASRYLLALAEAERAESQAIAYQGLARTMNQHLRDLESRDYRAAVHAAHRAAGRAGEIARVITIMYLPNEGAIEKLGKADADFMRRAALAQITPAGPAGLSAIIGFGAIEIGLMQQMENQTRIIECAERLLDSLTIALGHAGAVGRGIRMAAEGYAKLTGSLNGRVLPRARDMQRLGLRPAKPVPGNLPLYQVLELGADTIESEALLIEEDSAAVPVSTTN